MKNLKINLILLFITVSYATLAQVPVLTSPNIYNLELKDSYYLLLNQDDNDVYEDLRSFAKLKGRINEVRKNQYRIDKIEESEISRDLNAVDVVFQKSKKHLKIIFFFLDKKLKPIAQSELNEIYTKRFIQGFADHTQHKLSLRLAQIDLKMIEDQVIDAKKDVVKTEKQLESNLRDQEKLGKKLDSSPELLTKAISEKEEIVSKIYTEPSEPVDPTVEKDLKKASDKKEKEIAKIQKDKEKAMSKLGKKENEFDELRKKLVTEKINVKNLENILEMAVFNMKTLTEKL